VPVPNFSQETVEALSLRSEVVDPLRYLGVLDEGGGVVRLEAGVDEERSVAAPMLVLDEARDAVDVVRRIRSRERDPKEVSEAFGSECRIVGEDDEGESLEIE
jgi:hypothetical protein